MSVSLSLSLCMCVRGWGCGCGCGCARARVRASVSVSVRLFLSLSFVLSSLGCCRRSLNAAGIGLLISAAGYSSLVWVLPKSVRQLLVVNYLPDGNTIEVLWLCYKVFGCRRV